MAEVVDGGDGDKSGEEPGMDGVRGGADGVEAQGHEADAEVEGFAGDFVAVDKGAPGAVNGD